MHVAVLHQHLPDDAAPAELDVLVQCEAVAKSLERLGHRATALSATLDLGKLRRQLLALRPGLIFNLVESLAGTDRLMSLVPLLLESMELPATGSSAIAIAQTGDKLVAKRMLCDHRLPTPDWFANDSKSVAHGGYIVKPIHEHASRGIDGDSIVTASTVGELRSAIARKNESVGVAHFAEKFIAGREFNLSLLSTGCGQFAALPLAEIDFAELPDDEPAIVGHAAKWDESSTEYRATPRRFGCAENDENLYRHIAELGKQCAKVFSVGGYARVDVRVDADGNAWILEVNANPCLSPDAGFAAAVKEAGLTFDDAIARIVAAALD